MTTRETLASLASALGGDPDELRPLGGATGDSWALGEHIMRVGPPDRMEREDAAAAAASEYVPVPAVLARAESDGVRATLLTRIPGTPGWSPEMQAAQAGRRGRALGELHERIGRATAPGILPGIEPEGSQLVHLDLHPFNVLFDEHDEVSAVIDWANARAGTAEFDRARTGSIFLLDPAARAAASVPSWVAFVDGWAQTAAPESISPATLELAIEFLLHDLHGRHTDDELAPARGALEAARLGEPLFSSLR